MKKSYICARKDRTGRKL